MVNNIAKIEILGRKTNKYYKDLGYIFNFGDTIEVKIEDVPKGSNVLVDVSCDFCNKKKQIPYYNYCCCIKNQNIYSCFKCSKRKTEITNIEKYGFKVPTQNKEISEKIAKTNLIRYGFACSLQNDKVREKTKITNLKLYDDENFNNRKKFKETCLDKYNCENVFQDENIKNKILSTRVKHGIQMFPELKTSFQEYQLIVRSLTRKIKKELFEKWNGCDYYDNKYIKDNFNLKSSDGCYPTIDHKNSVFYGFMNNIPPEDISDISNLCITKRFINSSKNLNCYWKNNLQIFPS
jgi:hypothetical protein